MVCTILYCMVGMVPYSGWYLLWDLSSITEYIRGEYPCNTTMLLVPSGSWQTALRYTTQNLSMELTVNSNFGT